MLAAMVELIVFNHNCVEFPVWLLCACWGGGGLVYEAKFCFSGVFNSPVINSCIHLQVIDFYLNKLGLLWHEWAGR